MTYPIYWQFWLLPLCGCSFLFLLEENKIYHFQEARSYFFEVMKSQVKRL